MTAKQLREAQLIESDIYQTERDIKDIDEILKDYDNFGSEITFKRNKDSFSRSFGSKKNDLKIPIEQMIIRLRNNKEKELVLLKDKFKNL